MISKEIPLRILGEKMKIKLFLIAILCLILLLSSSAMGCDISYSEEELYESYDEGYDSGYRDGHYEGYDEGYDDGHYWGWDEGYGEGYDEAYRWGEDEFVYQGYEQGYSVAWRSGFISAIEIANDKPATELFLELSVTYPIEPGNDAAISANTLPNADCTIIIYYISGSSIDIGWLDKKANDSGHVSWTMDLETDTIAENWFIVVTARVETDKISKTTYLTAS